MFKDFIECEKLYTLQELDKNAKIKYTKVSLAGYWLSWPMRAKYNNF